MGTPVVPRRYRMQERASAVAATRDRIVAAATRLHAEHGIAATSWGDIAGAAGVSQATVYRHFGSLAELVPACARYVFVDIARIPSPEELDSLYAGLDGPLARLDRLVDNSVECYARAEQWLHAMFCEAPREPAMADAVASERAVLEALVAGALGHLDPLVRVLVDFPFFKQLRDAGLTPDQAGRRMKQLVRSAFDN
jgi:AcrR family transcriptional regulator